MQRSRIMLTSALVGTLLTIPQISIAQDTTALPQEAAPTGGIADIVVTARRTEESLQTTPVAVTALNSEALITAKVENVLDLLNRAR